LYYIIYPLLYLVSLLPFFILYRISDACAFFLARVFKYRREVVFGNLRIAFPDKTEEERKLIAKKFYQYFCDTFIESIKLLSLSKKRLLKRCTGSFDIINDLVEKGYNINVMAGHQFNWEYANLLYSIKLDVPFVGVYMRISNKSLNRIFFDIRKRYGTVLMSTTEFKEQRHDVFKKQYMLALAADQNPTDCTTAYWMNFFNHPTPFLSGPEKGAIKNSAAVVYVGFKKIKRGYYKFDTTLLTENAALTQPGEITASYRTQLEKTIKADPANYLWSHKRFKFTWKPEYGEVTGSSIETAIAL
jgi:KDO2-lipid IV(A) lauroyltransferase